VTVSVQVHGDQQVVDYLASLPSVLAQMILDKFAARARDVSTYIKDVLLDGVLLKRKSGKLANSIVARVYSSKNRVTLSVASRGDVPYASIYEKGGVIPSHVIRPKSASRLFFVGARDGKRLALAQVTSPSRSVRALHFLERGVVDKHEDFLSDIGAAIYDASRA